MLFVNSVVFRTYNKQPQILKVHLKKIYISKVIFFLCTLAEYTNMI